MEKNVARLSKAGFVLSAQFWGLMQLAVWPLCSGKKWRAGMASLNLSPGAALLDLSMRHAGHRSLAARYLVWWFCGMGAGIACTLATLAPVDGTRWVYASLGLSATLFSIILATGSSLAAGAVAITVWSLMTIAVTVALNPSTQVRAAMYAVSVATVAASLSCLRYRRNAGIGRLILTMLAGPLLAVPAWLLGAMAAIGGRFLPNAVTRGFNLSSFREGFYYLLESLMLIESVISGSYVNATPSMLLTAAKLALYGTLLFALMELIRKLAGTKSN